MHATLIFFKYLRGDNNILRFNGLGKSKILAEYAEKMKEINTDGFLSGLSNDDIAFVKAIAKYLQKVLYDGDGQLIKLWEAFVEAAVNKNLDKTQSDAVHKSFVVFLLAIVPKVYKGRKSTLDLKIVITGIQAGLLNIVGRSDRIYLEQLENDELSKLLNEINNESDTTITTVKKRKLEANHALSASSEDRECANTMQNLNSEFEQDQRYVSY